MSIKQIRADLDSESRMLEEAYVAHLHEHAVSQDDKDWAMYCDNLMKVLNDPYMDY